MLPAVHRMRNSRDFEAAVRRGRRAGRRTLVVHVAAQPAGAAAEPAPSRVGFVVSRAVGAAVVRTAVKRKLRAQVAARLEQVPAGTLVVIRANPAAARASSADLGADLTAALPRALAQLGVRPVRGEDQQRAFESGPGTVPASRPLAQIPVAAGDDAVPKGGSR